MKLLISTPEIATTFVLLDGTLRVRAGRIHVDRFNIESTLKRFQANRFCSHRSSQKHSAGWADATFSNCTWWASSRYRCPRSQRSDCVGNRGAVRQFRENARVNSRGNLKVFEGQVDATLEEADIKPDLVVLDPPRAGCGVKVAGRITELKPGRIVYVSCNPTTFAREASVFLTRGYDLKRLTLLDQFPNTYHVELIGGFELR